MELRVGVEQVLRRLPDYQISDESKCKYVGTFVTRGYHTLPVVFTPGPRLSSVIASGSEASPVVRCPNDPLLSGGTPKASLESQPRLKWSGSWSGPTTSREKVAA